MAQQLRPPDQTAWPKSAEDLWLDPGRGSNLMDFMGMFHGI